MLQRPKSLDRQNSSLDPCLQAGIMPVPIEIFDSNPSPVWSCMPSHCARIFSGLQVYGHDTALGMRTQIKWTITHNLIDLSSSAISFFFSFFWQTWQCCASFSPYYVPTIDSCCYSLGDNNKRKVDSCVLYYLFITKTWFRSHAVHLRSYFQSFECNPLLTSKA